MKIVHKDLRKGEIKVKTENLDDLWYLSNIIEPGDILRGKTIRKIKIGDSEQRKADVVKKVVFVSVKVEKLDFGAKSSLRVSGTIEEGTEDIPKGSHHTFDIDENTIVMIVKEKWLKYQLDKINEACQEKGGKIMIVVLDRDEADFALMKKYGFEMLNSIKGDVKKKRMEETASAKKGFYEEVLEMMKDYAQRHNIQKIVLGSPGFWKDEFMKYVKEDEIKKKLILATCSDTGNAGINEVLKRPEVRQALQEERAAKEINLVEELLSEISKNKLAAYGFREVGNAVEAGAVKTLLVTDSFIQKSREEGAYRFVEKMMKAVDEMNGDVVIVSGENDGGRKLNGLGGIGALLRYVMSY